MSEETLGAKHALNRLGLNTESRSRLVQEVREMIESAPQPHKRALELIKQLTGTERSYPNLTDSLHVAQYVCLTALEQDDMFNSDIAIAEAEEAVAYLRSNPKMSFIYAEERRPDEDTKEVSGVAVVIKANGKIKKGGKQVLALQLFRDHVVTGGADNKAFVKVLEQELDMSTQGATTYAYNARKAYEVETGKKFEMKKGDKA